MPKVDSLLCRYSCWIWCISLPHCFLSLDSIWLHFCICPFWQCPYRWQKKMSQNLGAALSHCCCHNALVQFLCGTWLLPLIMEPLFEQSTYKSFSWFQNSGTSNERLDYAYQRAGRHFLGVRNRLQGSSQAYVLSWSSSFTAASSQCSAALGYHTVTH